MGVETSGAAFSEAMPQEVGVRESQARKLAAWLQANRQLRGHSHSIFELQLQLSIEVHVVWGASVSITRSSSPRTGFACDPLMAGTQSFLHCWLRNRIATDLVLTTSPVGRPISASELVTRVPRKPRRPTSSPNGAFSSLELKRRLSRRSRQAVHWRPAHATAGKR